MVAAMRAPGPQVVERYGVLDFRAHVAPVGRGRQIELTIEFTADPDWAN